MFGIHSLLWALLFGGIAMAVGHKVVTPVQKRAIEDWASRNGYRLLESNKRFLREGPFTFKRSKTWQPNAVVYYVKVFARDGAQREGHIRHAWLRLHFPSGIFFTTDYEAEVRWDERYDRH